MVQLRAMSLSATYEQIHECEFITNPHTTSPNSPPIQTWQSFPQAGQVFPHLDTPSLRPKQPLPPPDEAEKIKLVKCPAYVPFEDQSSADGEGQYVIMSLDD